MKKTIDNIRIWASFNGGLVSIIILLSILIIAYYQINSKRQIFSSQEYTEEVVLNNIRFDKVYSSNIYNTKRKLDKIIFDVDYRYLSKNYKATTIVYWEYITPKLEYVLEKRTLEKLFVKCNKNNPEQIMVFVKE